MDTLTVRPTRPLIAAVIAVFLLACVALVGTSRASAGPPTWAPSAAEKQKALEAARIEASTSIPGTNGTPKPVPAGTWPANVKHVTLVGSSRKDAAQFVDGSPSEDDRRVVIIRLLGDFSIANTGPAGSNPFTTGHQMTLVVDTTTGDVLDFGLEPQPTSALPNGIQQYSR